MEIVVLGSQHLANRLNLDLAIGQAISTVLDIGREDPIE